MMSFVPIPRLVSFLFSLLISFLIIKLITDKWIKEKIPCIHQFFIETPSLR